MPITLTCPGCGLAFDATEAFQQQLEKEVASKVTVERGRLAQEALEEARKQFVVESQATASELDAARKQVAEAKGKELGLLRLQRELDDKAANQPLEVQRAIAAERQRLVESTRSTLRAELDVALTASQQAAAVAETQLAASRQRERDLRQEKLDLELKDQLRQIELEQRLESERQTIRTDMKAAADQDAALERKKNEDLNRQLRNELDQARRKLDQGSQQAQGEAQEIVLEQQLRTAFPGDEIREIGKGAEGADLLQVVRDGSGRACGSILWESKRTKAWSDTWLVKLAADRAREQATVAAIASQALPKGNSGIGQQEEIWICALGQAVTLASLLRLGILDVARARQALQGRTDKMSQLYGYLTSNEFRNRVLSVAQAMRQMRELLDRERGAMNRIWQQRERLISMADGGMTGMHADLIAIAGADLPSIPGTDDGVEELEGLPFPDPIIGELAAPPVDETAQQDLFLETLRRAGGSAGNGNMRNLLNWDPMHYDRVKSRLVDTGRVLVGPGRGGVVKLPDAAL